MSEKKLSHQERRTLRLLVLKYFGEPHFSRNMNLEPEFMQSGFSNQAIRKMMYSLERAGLIYKPRGTGSGSVYMLTQDGDAMIQVTEQLQALEDKHNQETTT